MAGQECMAQEFVTMLMILLKNHFGIHAGLPTSSGRKVFSDPASVHRIRINNYKFWLFIYNLTQLCNLIL